MAAKPGTGAKAAPAAKAAAPPASTAATSKSGALGPHRRFLSRVVSGAKVAAYLLAATLACGVLGYHFIAHLKWLIAFHQASLLLSGMGPVVTDLSDPGRVFESLYSLFCGVMLLGSTGILFTPFIHRMLHAFHVEDSASDK